MHHAGVAGLISSSLPQRDEIDRLQQNRWKAAVARDIGQDVRANGNRMRGHSTSSTGSIAFSGRSVQREHAGVGQFGDEDRRRRRCPGRCLSELSRASARIMIATSKTLWPSCTRRACTSRLMLTWGCAAKLGEDLRRARHLERQVLDVLDIHDQRLAAAGRRLRGGVVSDMRCSV